MVGPGNAQTTFVGIITSTINPYACFLSSFNYMDIKLTSNPIIITSKSNRIFFHILHQNNLNQEGPRILAIIDINDKLVACTHDN